MKRKARRLPSPPKPVRLLWFAQEAFLRLTAALVAPCPLLPVNALVAAFRPAAAEVGALDSSG